MIIYLFIEPIPSPTNLISTSTESSIFLQWEQDKNSLIDRYEIVYNYTVRRCGIPNTLSIKISISNDGTSRHNLSNSDTTPIEEDSEYSISLTAMNSVGRSESVNIQLSTLPSGILCISILIQLALKIYIFSSFRFTNYYDDSTAIKLH